MSETAVQSNNKAVAFQAKPTKERTMGKLNAAKRNALPSKDFAGPGRSYPIEDKGHAKAALARASEFASPSEDASIKRKVAKKFPSMKVKQLCKSGQISDRQAEKRGF